ncbi:MAG: hypothetical protein ABI167_13025 [Nitrosospira sp.]
MSPIIAYVTPAREGRKGDDAYDGVHVHAIPSLPYEWRTLLESN